MDDSQDQKPTWRELDLLFQTWDRHEAYLVCELMSGYGIETFVSSRLPHFLFPVETGGGFQVMVARERLRDAEQILADHLRRGLHVVPEGPQERERDDHSERDIDWRKPKGRAGSGRDS